VKVDQTTVDAVNAVLAKSGIVTVERYGATGVPVLDADDVAALILALAKCEPVAGLVEAAKWYEEMARFARKITCEGDAARNAIDRDGGKIARAALAPFTEGGGE
jgi:hypothetical protein